MRLRMPKLTTVAGLMVFVWSLLVTVFVVLSIGTKIDVSRITKPNVVEDQQISNRRIGRLTDGQLVELGDKIRQAQKRRAAEERRSGEPRPLPDVP